MILTFSDREGDPVAVEAGAIVALSVGAFNGPHLADPGAADALRVTLVHLAGLGDPLIVMEPFELVVRAWEAARQLTSAQAGEVAGWKYPPVVERSRG